MAFDNRRTYLCYNNRDLIRDGFIRTFVEKEFIPVSTFNLNRLKNPPKGVTYILDRDKITGEIISVRERKKLLPASKIKVEIDFSKVMKNAVSHPYTPGSLSFSPLVSIVTPLLSPIGFGGITSGFTEITFHILEAKTEINQAIIVTQEILDNKSLDFDGYPLSVFGIVTEHNEVLKVPITSPPTELKTVVAEYKEKHPQARFRINSSGETEAYIGLDFTSEQVRVLGKFSQGAYSGAARKRIDGATDSRGLFGGKADAELHIVEKKGESNLEEDREVVLFDGQKSIFDTIIRDGRKIKFRGDNFDANQPGEYPYDIKGAYNIDATDKKIRINTTGLKLKDTLYITYSIVDGGRYVRQNLEHKGTIGQSPTYGIIGFMGAIGSEVNAFDYQMREWKVPPLPKGIKESNIDKVAEGYIKDEDYKLTMDEFLIIDKEQREWEANSKNEGDFDLKNKASKIEGWRLSEAILYGKVKKFFAADYRGILYFNNMTVVVLYPRSNIRDQGWFTTYLESLEFTNPTGPPDPVDPIDKDGNSKLTYLSSDLEKKIEDNIDLGRLPGFLFDTSEITNSLLFDREKIHYYRPFANALKKVSLYNKDQNDTGIGIVSLDLLTLLCPNIISSIIQELVKGETVTYKEYDFSKFSPSCLGSLNLDYYDLSYGIFESVNAQSVKNYNCEDPLDIHSYTYFSNNYDAMNEGPGAWYDQGYIENELFEWRPDGGTIESYWKVETPYFCGDFSRSSRVYIEKMAGDSLDNYSWIYVDTEPSIPQNISSDVNFNSSSLMLVFKDENVHNSLCYHKIRDSYFEEYFPLVKTDKTRTHQRDTYDHDKDFIVGQNRILGDIPSYSYGIPITDDLYKICSSGEENFWFIKNLLVDTWGDGTSFGLDFSDDIPKAAIPFDWSLKRLRVNFSYTNTTILDIDKYVSFYFEGSESSISNYKVSEPTIAGNSYSFTVIINYYHSGPLQFLGKFWKKVTINEVNAIFARGNDEGILPQHLNIDEYKIDYGQNAVVYDGQGRMMVFYANEKTSNIDVAISESDGVEWFVHASLIRLTSSETATLPYVIKGATSSCLNLFYILNGSFLMHKRIDSSLFIDEDITVKPVIPETYAVGDYDMSLEDPDRAYWGGYTTDGSLIRKTPSYFIAGDAEDQYFKEQKEAVEKIKDFNSSLTVNNANKKMCFRFLFSGDEAQMKDIFVESPYAVYLSGSGNMRLFLISNGKLSIKRSRDLYSWYYDIYEQVIHKNYVDDKLNKGFPEEMSNIQIVRNDNNKNIISILYVYNKMLFVRHFQTNTLFAWYDLDNNLHDEQMKSVLEITDKDLSVSPPKERTKNIPIFLVGTIPDEIKKTIIYDIENNISPINSDLFFYFPYKDPDEPSNKEKNKEMVNRFNENFAIDVDTQSYGVTTSVGLMRIFYRDNFGNINGILVDALHEPILETMNIFRGNSSK